MHSPTTTVDVFSGYLCDAGALLLNAQCMQPPYLEQHLTHDSDQCVGLGLVPVANPDFFLITVINTACCHGHFCHDLFVAVYPGVIF